MTISLQGLQIHASNPTIEHKDISRLAQEYLFQRFDFHGNLQEEF
jgi:hypothetical protein